MSNGNDGPPTVEPGQLITADLMNRLLSRVEKLESRVSDLEAGRPSDSPTVVINDHSPKDIRVGQRLTLIGKNFAVPGSRNQISIGGIPVPDRKILQQSTETRLVFVVPEVGGLQEQATPVTVRVTTPEQPDATPQYELPLRPERSVPSGSIEVTYTESPLTETETIEGSTAYTFTFLATAFATRPGSYQATVTTSGQGWEARIAGASGDGSTLNFPLSAAPTAGASQDIQVVLEVPDQGDGATTDLRLEVQETTPNTQVSLGSRTETVEIGAEPPTPEDRVRISIRNSSGLSNGALAVPEDEQGFLSLNVRLFEQGTYRFQTELDDSDNWSLDPPQPNTHTVDTPVGGNGANKVVNLVLGAESGAQDTLLTLSVTNDAPTPSIDAKFVIPVTVESGS